MGPTLEFYALIAAELQKRSFGLWICDDDKIGTSEYEDSAQVFLVSLFKFLNFYFFLVSKFYSFRTVSFIFILLEPVESRFSIVLAFWNNRSKISFNIESPLG